MDIIVKEGLSINDLLANLNTMPEEVIAAGLDVIKNIETKLKDHKQAMSANLIRRMEHDNATKLPFIGVDGKEKVLTLKKGAMKLNPAIKNYEDYISAAGFTPGMLGEYKFTPLGWKDIKEIRKQGGNVQLVCDEMYKEGQPSLVIEEK